jgi:hypothetical protein
MSATTIVPSAAVIKDPNAARLYQFDFDDLLEAGAILTSYPVTAVNPTTDAADATITVGTPALASGSRKVNVLISGGTLGVTYRIRCTATSNTSPAGIEPRSFLITIALQ